MLEWLHENHIWIGCGVYGFFLLLMLTFHRIVGRYTRMLGWWLAAILAMVSGASFNGQDGGLFPPLHGLLLAVAATSIVVLAPVAVIIDRRRHGNGT